MQKQLFEETYDPENNMIILRISNEEESRKFVTDWYNRFINKLKDVPITSFINHSGMVINYPGAQLKSTDLRVAFNKFNNSNVNDTIFGHMMGKYINSDDNIYGIAKHRTRGGIVYKDIWLEELPSPGKESSGAPSTRRNSTYRRDASLHEENSVSPVSPPRILPNPINSIIVSPVKPITVHNPQIILPNPVNPITVPNPQTILPNPVNPITVPPVTLPNYRPTTIIPPLISSVPGIAPIAKGVVIPPLFNNKR